MRKLSVVNRSHHTIILYGPYYDSPGHLNLPAETKGCNVLWPSAILNCDAPRSCCSLAFRAQDDDEKGREWTINPSSFKVQFALALGASVKAVKTPTGCPWVIYLSKIAKKRFRLLILPRREMSRFLGEIPDSVPLSSVTLPGTHDTMAFYGWPISQCQSLATPLARQLHSGIRVLDIRLAVVKSRLIAYHGLYPQRASFQEILVTLHTFLTSDVGSSETIVMSIKQEDFVTIPGSTFSNLVRSEIMDGPGGRNMWFLDNRVPLLGEVRGKVIMFSRFGGDGEGWEGGEEGMGIHPTTWPDSARDGFEWDCKNTRVRTHDWYNIPSFLQIPEKTELAMRNLLPPAGPEDPPAPTLSISFFSAASFPLAFPPTIARGFGWPSIGFGVEGVNARLVRRLTDMLGGEGKNSRNEEPRLRGWALLDFYDDPTALLVPLLVECNFWGRVSGEEGWP